MIESKIPFYKYKVFQIAIFVDYLNQELGIKDYYPGRHFEYSIIENYVKGLGDIKLAKAYAPWFNLKIATDIISKFDINLIDTPIFERNNFKKDMADIKMAIDIIDTYYKYPEINLFVIISGDIDFLPAILRIRQNNTKKVIIISEECSLNRKYYGKVDKIVTYQRLLKIFRI
ncbi:MAG: NYN domain-containing protein [Candidatus Lokiarchaeia archaeon]